MDGSGAGVDDTELLLLKVKSGDRSAFEVLFARHHAFLRRFIEMRLDPKLRARVDPSDVVQETHLEAFARLEDYLAREPMPFRLWLRQTAFERMLKLRRQHLAAARRTVDREICLPDQSSMMLAQHFLGHDSTPSKRAVRQEDAQRVQEALAELAESDREIVLMRNLEGLSHAEIACVLGIDEAASRKRYGRSLLRLRKVMFDGKSREKQS
jgi:RNA polymerase sigma-70 factor (ECF subfamily)